MDKAESAVVAHNEIWRLTEQITATAIAPEDVPDETDVLHDFAVEAYLNSSSGLAEVLGKVGGVHRSEVAIEAGYFEVKFRAGIESELGDEIRCETGFGQKVSRTDVLGVIELRSIQSREGGR